MLLLKYLKSHFFMSVVVYGVAAAILAGALWFAYQYVEPAPPSTVTIAAGGRNGAYYKYATQYAEFFAKQGITLKILETKGAMDNLARMAAPDSEVDVAFMQGGIATPAQYPQLRSLGSLYYEPLWIFYRRGLKVANLNELHKLRVAIGPEGSGTNQIIRRLLDENGVTDENARFVEEDTSKSVPDLIHGRLDVLFVVAGIDSRVIETLSREGTRVRMLSLGRAEAYARSHHFLKRLVLPQGAINLAEDLPRENVYMLAPTANLVVREGLHPALEYLFLLAAREIHRQGDVFALPGEFPSAEGLLFPLTGEAENFYKKGPPLLMRWLPYTLAVNLERLKVLLIPLLTLLFPLFKITPPAFRWQIRRRIFKWYKRLKKLDLAAYEAKTSEEAEDLLVQLEEMDKLVLETSVPLSYVDAIYSLRIHINYIRSRMKEKLAAFK
ncbi:TAXI family TRAP transporter solute-binding subunit [Pseudodesulfovibrio sp.]|uniref:TAXI family TRAP transporter solute-binding subunit n=1 Tax=unclassified Pseudodesulfovibrio TaxID=2661612 RepID=UPI003B00DE00